MVYTFLKSLIKIAVWIFFSKVEVINKKAIPKKGPLIVVANHPNTFMDAILIAVLLKQQLYFLAKSTVFGSSIQTWVLTHIFNMIPVYRKQDLPKGQQADNNAVFDKCFEFLKNKGTLLIFPEGTSVMEQKLREIKTGTARIALGAEHNHNFNLGLKILPIGLNYQGGQYFRSIVSIEAAEPIVVKNYKDAYLINERATVTSLTNTLKDELEKQLVIAKNKNHELALKRASSIYQTEIKQKVEGSEHNLQKEMATALTHFTEKEPEFISTLNSKLDTYYRKLNYLNLKDQHLSKENLQTNIVIKSFQVISFLILGFPFWLLGIVTNYPAYKLPAFVASKVSKHIEYRAPVMLVVGMFSFMIYYALLFFVIWQTTNLFWLSLLIIPISSITGFFTLYYWQVIVENKLNVKLLLLFKKEKELITSLIEERKSIYFLLKEAREKYMSL